MSFADRLRAWFKGETKRAAPSPSTERASRESTRELAAFADSRHGVEAYLEPRTALYSDTVLLVAHDGEYLRRPVGSPQQAASFCKRHDIPLYDARKVGYPKRMRDYERGAPPRGISLDEMPPWPGGEAAPPAAPAEEVPEGSAQPEGPTGGDGTPDDPAEGRDHGGDDTDERRPPEGLDELPPRNGRDDDPPAAGASGG